MSDKPTRRFFLKTAPAGVLAGAAATQSLTAGIGGMIGAAAAPAPLPPEDLPSIPLQSYYPRSQRFPASIPEHLKRAILDRESSYPQEFPQVPLPYHARFAYGTDPIPASNRDRQGLLYRKGPYLRTILARHSSRFHSLARYKAGRISLKEELKSLQDSLNSAIQVPQL